MVGDRPQRQQGMISLEASRAPAPPSPQQPMEREAVAAAGLPPGEGKMRPVATESHPAPAKLSLPPSAPQNSTNSALLRRRRRLKRNLSANPLCPAAAPQSPATVGSRSLDRKSLLKAKQWLPLPAQDKEWVRAELRRGCLHIHEPHATPGLRPLLCTLDTTAAEVAARLLRPSSSGVLRVPGQASETTAASSPEPELFSGCGAWLGSPHKLSSQSWEMDDEEERPVCQGLFQCGAAAAGSSSSSSSSVEELSAPAVTVPARPLPAPSGGALYVQLHGETSRRLESHERPLLVQNDYLFQLGFRDLCRVQEEGMEPEIGCLIRFYTGSGGLRIYLKCKKQRRWSELSSSWGCWSCIDMKPAGKLNREHLQACMKSDSLPSLFMSLRTREALCIHQEVQETVQCLFLLFSLLPPICSSWEKSAHIY